MVEVSSGSVLGMEDERYADILRELNAKQTEMSMALAGGLLGALAGALALFILGAVGLLCALTLGSVGAAIGRYADQSRRSAVILYDLEGAASQAYEEVTKKFDALLTCAAKLHIDAGSAVQDIHAWKRNAGASHIIDKRFTNFGYELPRVLKSNITPPMMAVRKEKIYFLPDVLMVVHDDRIGAVSYNDLQMQAQPSLFIESGTVPPVAQVGHTWQRPTKSGGPDRRFANNRQIPICLYETFHFSSRNRLNELLEVSRVSFVEPFANSLKSLVKVTGTTDTALALLQS